jgi:hypothetical protein
MLQETAQEFGGAQAQGAPLLFGAVLIFEDHLAVIGAEDALGAQRGGT